MVDWDLSPWAPAPLDRTLPFEVEAALVATVPAKLGRVLPRHSVLPDHGPSDGSVSWRQVLTRAPLSSKVTAWKHPQPHR